MPTLYQYKDLESTALRAFMRAALVDLKLVRIVAGDGWHRESIKHVFVPPSVWKLPGHPGGMLLCGGKWQKLWLDDGAADDTSIRMLCPVCMDRMVRLALQAAGEHPAALFLAASGAEVNPLRPDQLARYVYTVTLPEAVQPLPPSQEGLWSQQNEI